MTLFEQGDFTLHSGGKSKYRINCDVLTDSDLEMVAQVLTDRLPPFSEVHGIPRGGLRLAEIMKQHMMANAPNIVIVDDVWTTGRSMVELREAMQANVDLGVCVYGAVIFQRGIGQIPAWCVAFADIDI